MLTALPSGNGCLGVPYRSQIGAGANYRRNDCGAACIAMLLAWIGRLGGLTVDALSAETVLASSDAGLSCHALQTLAARHGLDLFADFYWSLDRLRAEIGAGRPVIALIAYRWIRGRLDQADNQAGRDGHFVVVTGCTATHVLVNDPDWWLPGGQRFAIPWAEFQPAFQELLCQIVTVRTMTQKQTAVARLNDALAAVNDIQEATATSSAFAKTAQKLNVRSGPGLSYSVIGQLPSGACVPVVNSPATGWWQIDGWDSAFVCADSQYWVAV
jgi:hypothetical protein